ncbi:MAG: substrate-binding domain-containing protein [Armatimonadota bacterium]
MSDETIRAFSARACAAPMERAAERFTEQTGIDVELMVCSRHCHPSVIDEADASDVSGMPHFLTEVAEIPGLDLVVAGAGYLADDGEMLGILDPEHRVCLGYRRSALLVQPGNPKGIRGLADLERPNVTISISMIDCLKGSHEDVFAATHRSECIRPQIALRVSGCVALVEAVTQGAVDVAIGWSAFEHLAPGDVEIVELAMPPAIERETTISLRRNGANPAGAIRFLDFLRDGGADEGLVSNGWTLPEARA